MTPLISLSQVFAEPIFALPEWLTCSQCASLVKANVYDANFIHHLSLLWLPLGILAVVVAIIYRS
jgi:hypothetical protein